MRQGERRRHGRRGAGADAAGGNGKARGGVEPQGRPRGLRMSECWRKTRPGRGDLSRRAAPARGHRRMGPCKAPRYPTTIPPTSCRPCRCSPGSTGSPSPSWRRTSSTSASARARSSSARAIPGTPSTSCSTGRSATTSGRRIPASIGGSRRGAGARRSGTSPSCRTGRARPPCGPTRRPRRSGWNGAGFSDSWPRSPPSRWRSPPGSASGCGSPTFEAWAPSRPAARRRRAIRVIGVRRRGGRRSLAPLHRSGPHWAGRWPCRSSS